MIKIKALNESSSTSDEGCDGSNQGLMTKEAQEENFRSLYSNALQLVKIDKSKAKNEFVKLFNLLKEIKKEDRFSNIESIKYLTLKNLGNICENNLDYLLNALEIDGRDVALWIETGKRAMYKFYNFPLARCCFESCFQMSPKNWLVIDLLIDTYFVLNDLKSCFQLCIKSLVLDESFYKAKFLISEIFKILPSLKSELPLDLKYLKFWKNDDDKASIYILKKLNSLKENRKRKFEEDRNHLESKKPKLVLNLETLSLTLSSLALKLLKLHETLSSGTSSVNTLIQMSFDCGLEDISSTEDSVSNDNIEKEKKKENRINFPIEFLDKRRSTRVQRIQNRCNDFSEMSSVNISEKIFQMFPKSLIFAEEEVINTPKLEEEKNDDVKESEIVSRFISKQKFYKKTGRRLSDLIKNLLYEISNYSSFITIPTYFIDLYKIHRQQNPLPFVLDTQIGIDISIDELWCMLTANEIQFNKAEAIFLTQMSIKLETFLDKNQFEKFIIRLMVIRGTKEMMTSFLVYAYDLLSKTSKKVFASNRTVYTSSIVKFLMNSLKENSLSSLFVNQKYEEIIEILIAKIDLSESEEKYLCQAIVLSENWNKGIESIAKRKILSERILKTLNTCLKKGNNFKLPSCLAKRLLKLAIDRNSVLSWACILQIFISEIQTIEDEENVVNFINTIHQYLGKKGKCTSCNGEFLLVALDYLINQHFDTKDNLILQCFSCLYDHPLRKSTLVSSTHTAPRIPLSWNNVEMLYNYFIPEDLPEFDSLRRISIDSDTEILLKKIVPLVPSNYNPINHVHHIKNFLETGKEISTDLILPENTVTQNLYYFLADYYFKNKEFNEAQYFYSLDLCINRDRFDSWAACALSFTHLIDLHLSSGDKKYYTNNDAFQKLTESAFRCYSQALKLEPDNTKLWIEYGNSAYNVASYNSRLKKAILYFGDVNPSSPSLQVNRLKRTQKRMLRVARRCFQSANNTQCTDEMWLHYYLLGKIAEKSDLFLALHYYELADIYLSLNNATYPKKISYHTPSRLSIEALEIHYRIHAATLKYLRSSHSIPKENLLDIEYYLIKALRSPFVKQVNYAFPTVLDHDYTFGNVNSPNFANKKARDDIRETIDDIITITEDELGRRDEKRLKAFLVELCLSAMRRCLKRYPNHYKSLYQLAHHFFIINEFMAARTVLLACFTTSPGSSLSKLKEENLETSKGELIYGLFSERKNHNLFNGIWRIPIDDIDRPGSFSTHMYRSTFLLIKVCTALLDHYLLLTLAIQLNKTPEAGKKYLRDVDRMKLSKEALERCFLILKNRITEVKHQRDRLESLVIEVRRVSEKLMKCNIFTKETAQFSGELYKIITN